MHKSVVLGGGGGKQRRVHAPVPPVAVSFLAIILDMTTVPLRSPSHVTILATPVSAWAVSSASVIRVARGPPITVVVSTLWSCFVARVAISSRISVGHDGLPLSLVGKSFGVQQWQRCSGAIKQFSQVHLCRSLSGLACRSKTFT